MEFSHGILKYGLSHEKTKENLVKNDGFLLFCYLKMKKYLMLKQCLKNKGGGSCCRHKFLVCLYFALPKKANNPGHLCLVARLIFNTVISA